MARSAGTRPRRTLGVLAGLILVLYGVIAAGVTWSDGQWTPKLALDLEGGTEVVLAPKLAAGAKGTVTPTALAQAVDIIRQRINGNGVSEAEVTVQGENIAVSIPGEPDPETLDLIRQSAQLRFRAVLAATTVEPAASPTQTPAPTPTGTSTGGATTKPSAPATIKPPGTAAPTATSSTNGRPVPGALKQATPTPAGTAASQPAAGSPAPKPTGASDLAWAQQPVPAKPSTTYEEQFVSLDCTSLDNTRGGIGDDPAKPLVACERDGSWKYLLGPAELVGTDVDGASAGLETNASGNVTGAGWQVNLSFTGEGGKKFADVTTRLASLTGAQNQFAIVLDGVVVSAPQTRQAILTGDAQITGSFNEQSATTLANQLKYGALPLSFQPLTQKEISATLGTQQLKRGLLAGAIGLFLVVVYSFFQYRALAMVTVASLGIAGVITYGLVVLLGWRQGYRLSLAGVAGLIVSIGITADSFIVFFERVRDEVRDGRSLLPAVEAAWSRARRTILASDSVSFLAAVVLFVLAIGGVRGFAFTLGLTTLIDVLVVFMFTKPMVTLLSQTKFFGGGHRWSGFDAEHLGRNVAYAGRARVRGGETIAARRAAERARATGQKDQDTAGADDGRLVRADVPDGGGGGGAPDGGGRAGEPALSRGSRSPSSAKPSRSGKPGKES